MRTFWAIFKRELFSFFVTPLAWVLGIVFLILQGMHFFLLVDRIASDPAVTSDQSPLTAFFGETVLVYVILFLFIPSITMRLFAEERRLGTIEPLMTAPVSSVAVVLAKYAAAVAMYVAMWLPTLFYVVILKRAGGVDPRVVASSYFGIVLVGSAYLAIGLLLSAVTRSQFIALLLTALAMLAFFIVGVAEYVAREGTALHALANHVSLWGHMSEFASGIVDSRRLVFYGSIALLSLFLTTRVVDSWRWS